MVPIPDLQVVIGAHLVVIGRFYPKDIPEIDPDQKSHRGFDGSETADILGILSGIHWAIKLLVWTFICEIFAVFFNQCRIHSTLAAGQVIKEYTADH